MSKQRLPPTNPPRRPQQRSLMMSLESAADEERIQVLNLLNGRKPESQQRPQQQEQPRRHASPQPPVRSMLDVSSDAGPPPKHGSIAGIGVGVTVPPNSNRPTTAPSNSSGLRNFADRAASPSPLRSSHTATSTPTSPVDGPSGDGDREHKETSRRASDTASTSHLDIRSRDHVDISQDYQFEMLPSIPNQALPKRVSQGGKKHLKSHNSSHHNSGGSGSNAAHHHQSSMATVMSGSEFGPLPGHTRGRELGRSNSTLVTQRHSKSPSSRAKARSRSPGGSLLNTNSFNPMSSPGKFVTESGKVISLDHAYRRLSNTALSNSGGSLAYLPKRASTSHDRDQSADSTLEGESRVPKDYYSDTPEGGASEDYTSDENEDASSGDDDLKSESQRGRRRTRKKSDSESKDGKDAATSSTTATAGSSKKIPRVRSLLAAAEEERSKVSYKVKSLLDPPAVDKALNKKVGVHPTTSFDYAGSGDHTPVPSDEEGEYSDIKKAQNLAIYSSPIDQTVRNRVIRTVIRGDFTQMQQEAEEGRHRLRKYLVATDLSAESAYALEWTIGTILRDGDTLYAIYAADEDNVNGKGGSDADTTSSTIISDGAKAIQDIAAVVGSQTAKTAENLTSFSPSPNNVSSHASSGGSGSKTASPDTRSMPRGDAEGHHAIENISQTCVRLLRKTRLQVRVAIEVIHCKNPKHLITEAIDGLEPTLVILGSRGRNALKGVLLGSFSNYVVTKSSVPVMVARKKLRKHNKFSASRVRLSNNLRTPTKLANAKID